ncbi:SusC/RagA family TonB-linked outer membrane protein [Sphingobacterium hungaricum]|uniref:TonB-dependent receptor n=1 Tax=Sphingobacterium hungaricum TaxID=2082723 RepID=A0A928YQY1_9SPHI|nr:TonB-dependent receptor [Sphingobacterium hungaricum]MBE8714419.1 TonB-dependent receptor [Sphingobacterium hungaricum]
MKEKLRFFCKNGLAIFLIISFHSLFAQTSSDQMTITGKVRNNLNQPVAGVSVTNLTSLNTVATNDLGSYQVTGARGDSIEFRYIGYKTQRIAINTTIELNVVLEGEDNSLNEVVVVGYGQQRKINMVGAQSTVKVEDLKQPVANLSASLAGRIAGLVGVQRTGLPGSNSADVWIRGISTFNSQNSASPLIVVDGVQGRDLNAFDPEDISTLTILKDASATAVYGAQGANGVILITTKKGRSGKPTLMFNYNQGMVDFTKTPELTNAEQYMRLRNEAMVSSNLSPEYSEEYIQNTLNGTDPYLYPNVNWMDALFKNASYNRRANFSARGGSDNTQYYTSLAYYDESSLLNTDALQSYKADTRFRRYNFTSNVDMNWTKTTKFTLGVQGYVTNTNYPGTNPQTAFSRVMQTNPVLYPLMYPGNLIPSVNQSSDAQPNPYALVTQTGYQNIFSSQLYSNARITQELDVLTTGLSAYAMFSFDTFNSHTISRTRNRTTYNIDRANPYKEDGSLNLVIMSNGSDDLSYARANSGDRQFYFESGLNYNRQFDKHGLSGLLLYTQTDEVSAFAGDLTSSLPFRTQRIVGRANYLYDDRYAAEFNFAYDGSENFLPSRRFGFFPSFGVGWILSNEQFFEPLKETFQMVKLRYSNGITGSGGGGRRFGFMTIVSTGANGYSFYNGSSNIGYGGVAISDYGYDVTWAESRKQDLGLEFTTLNGKLNVTVDWFKENRTGVFLQRGSLPNYLGLQNQPYGNLGKINNQGFDGTVAMEGVEWGKTTWSFNGTFSYNKDQVIENDSPKQLYPYLERRGRNFLSTYGYVADGLFQSQGEVDNHADQSALGAQRVGDIRYKDLNGDGVINTYDQTKIGNGDVPNLVYGAGFNVSYKNIYFGAFFQGIEGAERLISGDGIIPFNNSTGAERSNLYAIAESRWTPENPSDDVFYPRLGYGNSVNTNNAVASTWWVKDIDFLRLKTLDLGYYLPAEKLKSLGVKNARIYFQGVNLLYWSKFKLWDPELNTANGSSYPNTRTFSLGIQANF